MANSLDLLKRDVAENTKDIGGLKQAVYGDNNGRPGLIRRNDRIDFRLNILVKLCWAIVVGVGVRLVIDAISFAHR